MALQTVRVAALELLSRLAYLPYPTIHPYRATVINGIAPALDDPKRPVRAAATACRTHWFLVGGASAGASADR